jgi:hypothetical protein
MIGDGDASRDASRRVAHADGRVAQMQRARIVDAIVAVVAEHGWPAGVRAALAALLELFDSEPQLARAWLLEPHAAGICVLEQRERELELPAVEMPAMLLNVKAERARGCVLCLAKRGRQGFSPSNREIAAAVGIAHKGQISKLLARLEAAGVLSKISHGAGRPNAWQLTEYGQEIAAYFELREKG